jgi:hypothetical protein
MAAKLTRLTHKIAIQLYPVAESYTICSSRSRRQVRKLLDLHLVCLFVRWGLLFRNREKFRYSQFGSKKLLPPKPRLTNLFFPSVKRTDSGHGTWSKPAIGNDPKLVPSTSHSLIVLRPTIRLTDHRPVNIPRDYFLKAPPPQNSAGILSFP